MGQILVKAANSSQAMQSLYLHYKTINPKYSLSYICQRAQISSKGYLSDVMRGTRTIHLKYLDGIIKAFNLTGSSATLFRVLVQIDHERDPKKVLALNEKRQRTLKSLKIVRGGMPSPITSPFFMLELFCRLGLFGNRVTRANLIKHYSSARRPEVEEAIKSLIEGGMIQEEEGFLRPKSDQFVFNSSKDQSEIQFLRDCLNRILSEVEKWYRDPESTHIEASIISVEERKYKKILPQLKSMLAEVQSDMESGNADKLILFNVQVLPLI